MATDPRAAMVSGTQRATRREWFGLGVLALPCLLYSMDLTVLNLAVPRISVALRPSGPELLWMVDIYGFLLAGFLIPMDGQSRRPDRAPPPVAGWGPGVWNWLDPRCTLNHGRHANSCPSTSGHRSSDPCPFDAVVDSEHVPGCPSADYRGLRLGDELLGRRRAGAASRRSSVAAILVGIRISFGCSRHGAAAHPWSTAVACV